jgi:excisionase family DNA binding protein
VSPERFCACERPQAVVEGVHYCHRCGYALKPAPSPAPAELIAEKVVERLAGRLGRQQREPWVGVAAAAEHLNCDTRRVYDLCSKSDLPHAKEGARSLFRLSELDAWLERRNAA